jgi:hypothetical protein
MEARKFVQAKDTLYLFDFLFLGHPLFDPFALPLSKRECLECPLFSIERKVLEKEFLRPSKQTGYTLNEEKMPPIGAKVKCI